MSRLALSPLAAALLAVCPAAAQSLHFFEAWDLDGDGQVTVEELAERRADVFVMFDEDENEILSPEEYAVFDETRAEDQAQNAAGRPAMMARVQAGMTLGFNDLDGDGAVSREEFLSRAGAWLASIDATGDGVITTEDFRR